MADVQQSITKRKRAPRRDFKKEIRELETYCRLSVDILTEGSDPLSEFNKGQVAAFEKVLGKVEQK